MSTLALVLTKMRLILLGHLLQFPAFCFEARFAPTFSQRGNLHGHGPRPCSALGPVQLAKCRWLQLDACAWLQGDSLLQTGLPSGPITWLV